MLINITSKLLLSLIALSSNAQACDDKYLESIQPMPVHHAATCGTTAGLAAQSTEDPTILHTDASRHANLRTSITDLNPLGPSDPSNAKLLGVGGPNATPGPDFIAPGTGKRNSAVGDNVDAMIRNIRNMLKTSGSPGEIRRGDHFHEHNPNGPLNDNGAPLHFNRHDDHDHREPAHQDGPDKGIRRNDDVIDGHHRHLSDVNDHHHRHGHHGHNGHHGHGHNGHSGRDVDSAGEVYGKSQVHQSRVEDGDAIFSSTATRRCSSSTSTSDSTMTSFEYSTEASTPNPTCFFPWLNWIQLREYEREVFGAKVLLSLPLRLLKLIGSIFCCKSDDTSSSSNCNRSVDDFKDRDHSQAIVAAHHNGHHGHHGHHHNGHHGHHHNGPNKAGSTELAKGTKDIYKRPCDKN